MGEKKPICRERILLSSHKCDVRHLLTRALRGGRLMAGDGDGVNSWLPRGRTIQSADQQEGFPPPCLGSSSAHGCLK
jgi:hypothetical protein